MRTKPKPLPTLRKNNERRLFCDKNSLFLQKSEENAKKF